MDNQYIDQERLELALEAAGLDLWENDLLTGAVTRRSTKVFAELGYTEQEALSYIDDLYKIVHPDDVSVVNAAIACHMAGESAQYRCEFRLRTKNNEWVWYANYGKIMQNDKRRFVGVTFNIDDRKRKEDEIEEINRKLTEQNALLESMNARLKSLAATDPLTSIANRRKLMEVGEVEFKRARRFSHPLSLLIMDIDHFKQVNDAWGHPTGDRVIQSVADICVHGVRGNVDLVARIGGEEFAVVMPETDYSSAVELAERLRQSVAAHRIPLDQHAALTCTISTGVATLTDSCAAFDQLLGDADKSLYRAKKAGRNCVKGNAEVSL